MPAAEAQLPDCAWSYGMKLSWDNFSGRSLTQVPQTNKVDEGGSSHPALCQEAGNLCHPRTRGASRAGGRWQPGQKHHHITPASNAGSWTLQEPAATWDPGLLTRGRYRGLRRAKAPGRPLQ